MKKRGCVAALLLFGFTACQPNSTPATETAAPVAPDAAHSLPTQEATPDEAATSSAASGSPSDSVQQVASFIPAGYKLLDVISGDLNLDALPDKVLVLQKLDTDTTMAGDTLNRPLLLLLGQPNRRYRAQPATTGLCSVPAAVV